MAYLRNRIRGVGGIGPSLSSGDPCLTAEKHRNTLFCIDFLYFICLYSYVFFAIIYNNYFWRNRRYIVQTTGDRCRLDGAHWEETDFYYDENKINNILMRKICFYICS